MIRVGTAGWSYPDWEGVVYPRRKPPGFHPLRYLAEFLGCMEINSSFYREPRSDHARRWLACVADRPDFRFWAKLHRAFTHEAPGTRARMEERAELFRRGLEPLREGAVLAGLLVQLPHSFAPSARAWARLEWIAGAFGPWCAPGGLVVELRRREWFEPAALSRLSRLDVSLARIDLPSARDHPPPEGELLGPVGYLRLHGRNARAWFDRRAGRDQRYDYLYGPEEVKELVDRALRLAAEREAAYVVANNHYGGQALVNALQIEAALTGARPPAPPTLVAAFPELASSVRPEPQGGLFD